jgi:hypothetical protein
VWATRISFLDVLSAVPPFLSHARKSKPAERRDRSQSTLPVFESNTKTVRHAPLASLIYLKQQETIFIVIQLRHLVYNFGVSCCTGKLYVEVARLMLDRLIPKRRLYRKEVILNILLL